MSYIAYSPNDPSPARLTFKTEAEALAHKHNMDGLIDLWPGEPWSPEHWKSRPLPWVVEPKGTNNG